MVVNNTDKDFKMEIIKQVNNGEVEFDEAQVNKL